jgi:cell division protein FtsW
MLSKDQVRLISCVGLGLSLVMLIIVLIAGDEIKGAKRWISLLGVSIQPSEFVKPFIAVINGWLLAKYANHKDIMSFQYSFILYAIFAGLILMQPDVGMMITVTAICGAQIFFAGIPIFFAFLILLSFIFGLFGAYLALPHVAKRIDGFLNPDSVDNFQINKSLLAIAKGGMFGKGPGEGVVKHSIPDSHADFIFAVIGEELGIFVSISIIAIYAFIVIRGYIKIAYAKDLFAIYATVGLLMQIALQSIVNIGVAVKLMPAKGMTLPFVSYGGSSMIASSLTVGMILALTRKKYGLIKRGVFNL